MVWAVIDDNANAAARGAAQSAIKATEATLAAQARIAADPNAPRRRLSRDAH